MPLDVENKLVFLQLCCGKLRVQRRLGVELEPAAGLADPGIRLIERQKGAGGTTCRDQEFTTAERAPFRVVGRVLMRQ